MVEDDVQDMIEEWDAPEVQKNLKKLLKKRNKKKDPNKPKRPRSSYLFFCKKMRPTVKDDLGKDCNTKDVTSELGRRWNKLKVSHSKKDKKLLAGFVKEAKADKERYNEEIKNYVPSSEEELSKVKKKKSGRPKRTTSAFLFFCKEVRPMIKEENVNINNREIMRVLGKRWKELKASDSAKDKRDLAKYNNASTKDKERYDAEMEVYNSSLSPIKKSSNKKSLKKSNSKSELEEEVEEEVGEKVEEKVEEELEEEQPTSFDLYCQAHWKSVRHRYPKYTNKQKKFKLVQMWNALSMEEKEEWDPERVESV